MWAPEPVWTGMKSFILVGIRCPNRAPLSESLCRLSYPNPNIFTYNIVKFLLEARQKKASEDAGKN
jgi:hypothetical protein